MIKQDHVIQQIAYGDVVKKLADSKNIGLTEARQELSRMGFKEYHRFVSEAGSAIVPPSGQTIGPTSSSSQPQKSPTASKSPQQIKAIWPGNDAPVEVGMTVGLKDPQGIPVPGQVSQVDMSANGVKVKNPTTGQDEWMNTDQLEPFMVNQSGPSNTTNQRAGNNDLQRLKELAGISENCSGGATGAGAIAIAPAPMGRIKKREQTEETLNKEYTPREAAKTIIGDTKPNQASGQLSATLAANGSKTAKRINNGMKRR